jgi:hypothetical protein
LKNDLFSRRSRIAPPVFPDNALYFSGAGLTLGGRLIAPHPVTALDRAVGDRVASDRLDALLALAFRKKLAPHLLRHIEVAAAHSRRGDHVQANIRLAMAWLTYIPEPAQIGLRLDLADKLLSGGMPAGVLLKELDLEPPETLACDYNPDQPRVPAGNGGESGRWTSGGGGGQSAEAAKPPKWQALAPPAAVPALFEAAEEAARLAALAEFAGALVAVAGATAVLGLLFVPYQHSDSSSGVLPGESGTRYEFNREDGSLRLIDTTGSTPVVIAAGLRDRNGVFYDFNTGFPFARDLGDVLTFDQDQIDAAARSDNERESAAAPASKDKGPKLCEDPGPDAPHGACDRANAYQEQISALNNPQRPLPSGWAVSMINPRTGRRVYYDDCRELDGTMIEAKGPGFGDMLRSDYMRDKIGRRWTGQAARQVAASGGRDIEWYFADQKAADFARRLFNKSEELKGIRTQDVEAVVR